MKTYIWIIASLILHFALALSFVITQTPPAYNEEVLDLTVLPSYQTVAPTTKKTPTLPRQKSTVPSNESAKSLTESGKPSEYLDSQIADNENPSEGPVSWGEVTTLPKILKEVKAPYPPQAKEARIEGPVILDVTVSSEGHVREVSLINGPGYGLNESAIEALRKFEFSPAFKGSQKVAVKIRYTYRFKLGVN